MKQDYKRQELELTKKVDALTDELTATTARLALYADRLEYLNLQRKGLVLPAETDKDAARDLKKCDDDIKATTAKKAEIDRQAAAVRMKRDDVEMQLEITRKALRLAAHQEILLIAWKAKKQLLQMELLRPILEQEYRTAEYASMESGAAMRADGLQYPGVNLGLGMDPSMSPDAQIAWLEKQIRDIG